MKEKLKKRCKLVLVEELLKGKIQHSEFKKTFEKMDSNFKLLDARVNHSLNMFKVDMQKALEKKADAKDMENLTKTKADIEDIMEIKERLAQMEDFAK